MPREYAQSELIAEEVADELLVGSAPQLLRRPHLDDAAVPHEHDAVAQDDRLLDVVGDEDHRLAQPAVQVCELALEPLPADGVECPEGLVHEQHRRIGCQSSGDPDALRLASGELARPFFRVHGRIEPHELEQFGDPLLDPGCVPAQEPGDGGDVPSHRHVGEEAHALDGVADVTPQFLRRDGGDGATIDEHLAGVDLDHAVDGA